MRALIGYLILVWVLIKFTVMSGGASLLVSAAVLAGFPLVVVVTRLLDRHGPRWLRGGWAVAVAAIMATISVPLACLTLHDAAPGPRIVHADDVRLMPARLVADHLSETDADRLRLRIRGLTLIAQKGPAGETLPAELVLNTSIRERDGRREFVIDVELRESSGGRVQWRERYHVESDDMASVHAALRRALSEAMQRTREGLHGGQLVRTTTMPIAASPV